MSTNEELIYKLKLDISDTEQKAKKLQQELGRLKLQDVLSNLNTSSSERSVLKLLLKLSILSLPAGIAYFVSQITFVE